jgi:hypothetical protein
MLNKLTFPPAHPWRAKPRRFPRFILGSSISSRYPSGEELPGSSGRAGEEDYYTSRFLSPAASLDDWFEHSKRLSSVRLRHI